MPRLHYTFEILGAFIGALFGVLIADYYLVKKQRIVKDDLFTMSKTGTYWYKGGYNAEAVAVTVISAAVAVFPVLFGDLPGMTTAAQYSWFVGCSCRSRSTGPPRATARFRRPTSVSRSRSRRYNRHRASAAGQPEHDPVDDGGNRLDAYVLVCFGDPGFAEARAMLDVPVLRIDSDSATIDPTPAHVTVRRTQPPGDRSSRWWREVRGW